MRSFPVERQKEGEVAAVDEKRDQAGCERAISSARGRGNVGTLQT